MLFLLSLREVEFSLKDFSPEYQNHYNPKNNSFKCISEDKYITIDQFADGICDCCDGSDEAFNFTAVCPNKCPHNLQKYEIDQLKTIFKQAIVNRVALGAEGTQLLKDQKELLAKQEQDLKDEQDLNAELKKNLTERKTELDKWIYETNEVSPPDPKALEAARLEYINRVEKVTYKSNDDEEEADEDSVYKFDEEDLKKKKIYRANKWEAMQEEKYYELLGKAVEKYRSKGGTSQTGFMHRLKSLVDNEQPPIVEAYNEASGAYNASSSRLQHLYNDIQQSKNRLAQDYGEDAQWFGDYAETITGPIEGTDHKLQVTLFHRASIRLPSTGCARSVDLGAFAGFDGAQVLFRPDRVEIGGPSFLKLRAVCYPKLQLLAAGEASTRHVVAFLGAPEICPRTFDEASFEAWLREIAPYKSELIGDIASEL